MINNSVLVGRLTKDIELKETANGKYANFTLAVTRKFKNQNGEYDADFVQCIAWNKTAEILSMHTHKGELIGIEGRIQTRNFQNNQGQRIYVTEIVVGSLTLMERKKQDDRQTRQELDESMIERDDYGVPIWKDED
ncbi:hypothetical protein BG261_02865 [Floricoccus tropicus]|uniref:Single-stranded DNA-binding protein n=1 Tax=Floricoccus tropicus TaxID=1859473 RepID=A0A1E8GMZ6_9LACT|nr:single-stranded DNA-binding protein [Floricoccus tropicus]OFI49537.1 hypothetical protein BG261_02865 [Floricoccus tropicus]